MKVLPASFQARLDSFGLGATQPKTKSKTRRPSARGKKASAVADVPAWPYSDPKPYDLAFAGFVFRPTSTSPDNVQCFECNCQLDGWEESDVPAYEHLTHAPECGFAINVCIRMRHSDPNRVEEDPMSDEMMAARRFTFRDYWDLDVEAGYPSVDQMVEAGWYYDPSDERPDGVTCPYCTLSLDCWDAGDDPLEEHRRRAENCLFFALKELYHPSNIPYSTAKGKRGSKSKRGSAASTTSVSNTKSKRTSTASTTTKKVAKAKTTRTKAAAKTKSGRTSKRTSALTQATNTDVEMELEPELEPEPEPESEIEVPVVRKSKRQSVQVFIEAAPEAPVIRKSKRQSVQVYTEPEPKPPVARKTKTKTKTKRQQSVLSSSDVGEVIAKKSRDKEKVEPISSNQIDFEPAEPVVLPNGKGKGRAKAVSKHEIPQTSSDQIMSEPAEPMVFQKEERDHQVQQISSDRISFVDNISSEPGDTITQKNVRKFQQMTSEHTLSDAIPSEPPVPEASFRSNKRSSDQMDTEPDEVPELRRSKRNRMSSPNPEYQTISLPQTDFQCTPPYPPSSPQVTRSNLNRSTPTPSQEHESTTPRYPPTRPAETPRTVRPGGPRTIRPQTPRTVQRILPTTPPSASPTKGWDPVDIEAFFDKENLPAIAELTSPEKQMTIEEFLTYEARRQEAVLREQMLQQVGLLDAECNRALAAIDAM